MTARLSRKFYDAFGEDAVHELVDWMNAVDLGCRTDLRQINEANVARFNAHGDARTAGETRFAAFEARMLRWMLLFWTATMVGTAATVASAITTR